MDDAHKALFGTECLNLWLAFICDFAGAAMVLGVGCFALSGWRTLGSSAVGLAFSQSIQMLVRAWGCAAPARTAAGQPGSSLLALLATC